MKLPFGKHKGEEIEDVPSPYLRWFTENVSERGDDGKPRSGVVEAIKEIDKELAWRDKHRAHFDH